MCKHLKTAPGLDLKRGYHDDSQCWDGNPAAAIHVYETLLRRGRDAVIEVSHDRREWRVAIYDKLKNGKRDWDTIAYVGPDAMTPGFEPYWVEACCERTDQLAFIRDGLKAKTELQRSCQHDWQQVPGMSGLIEQCSKCAEERA